MTRDHYYTLSEVDLISKAFKLSNAIQRIVDSPKQTPEMEVKLARLYSRLARVEAVAYEWEEFVNKAREEQ